MTLTTSVDPDSIEVAGSTPEEARNDLQRQHQSWEAPEIGIDSESLLLEHSQFVELFEALEEEDSDIYAGDGVEVALIEPIEGDLTYIHIRWSVSFEFAVQGENSESTLSQLEEFSRRCILINGLRVERVEIELDEE